MVAYGFVATRGSTVSENVDRLLPETSSVSLAVKVHTRPEEFEYGGSTLKTYQIFSVCTAAKKFKNAPIAGHIYIFLLRKTQS